MHQRGALAVATGSERPGLYEDARIGKDVGSEISQPMKLAPAIGQILQEYRNVVVRPVVRIAASAGAEQHDALDPIAIELIEGGANAPQDVAIGCASGRRTGSVGSNSPEASHSASQI
jgi:hypothetical protein